MKSCAFLTMDSLENFDCYDHLLFQPFKQIGWQVDEVSWRNKEVDWDQYEAVIIRSPWDYQEDAGAFLRVLGDIEQSSATLENSLELVEWNINKTYLRDLQEKDVEIVPTLWRDTFNSRELDGFFEELDTNQIVIKPTISAGADDTFWIRRAEANVNLPRLSEIFRNRPFMVQPFMPHIVAEGEFSLFFFGNTYSHTILKTPRQNDFRVQEEHGGTLAKVEPEVDLVSTAENLQNIISPQALYTRADYVRTENNSFALMELELIEPSLYFNMDPDSPQRFAQVFQEWMKSR